MDPIFSQQFNMPKPQPKGGMFGNGKFGVGEAIVAALNGYLAGTGNPAGAANMRAMQEMMAEKRRRQQENDDYDRKRTDTQADWRSQYDYKLEHPEPTNNDTANDYSFWQSHLSPEQFQEYVSNKVNPPQYMNVPGVGLVQVPRQGAAQAPTAPVGKLTPLGAGGPGASPGGFQRF